MVKTCGWTKEGIAKCNQNYKIIANDKSTHNDNINKGFFSYLKNLDEPKSNASKQQDLIHMHATTDKSNPKSSIYVIYSNRVFIFV